MAQKESAGVNAQTERRKGKRMAETARKHGMRSSGGTFNWIQSNVKPESEERKKRQRRAVRRKYKDKEAEEQKVC